MLLVKGHSMYNYETEKPFLFTDEGQRMFLKIRDRAFALIKTAGVARMDRIMDAGVSGSSWSMLACVDRMVELGELREIPQDRVPGQHRVFYKSYE